jgi:hypothetical protein
MPARELPGERANWGSAPRKTCVRSPRAVQGLREPAGSALALAARSQPLTPLARPWPDSAANGAASASNTGGTEATTTNTKNC